MKKLPINIKTFGFAEREYKKAKRVAGKCGRDFLYYSLNYYFPEKFNKNINNPLEIDKNKIFGFPVSLNFAWTMIQFYKVPKLFQGLGLSLSIGDGQIKTFKNFLTSIINPERRSAQQAINEVEKTIDEGSVAGIDISLGLGGLYDHVMFVYGYDLDNLYVFDTHKVSGLEYEKITEDDGWIMKISKDTIRKRWTRFGRVWIIRRNKDLLTDSPSTL